MYVCMYVYIVPAGAFWVRVCALRRGSVLGAQGMHAFDCSLCTVFDIDCVRTLLCILYALYILYVQAVHGGGKR